MERMIYTEFLEEVQKKRTHKKMKVTNSFGMKKIFNSIRENNLYSNTGLFNISTLGAVVSRVNRIIAKAISDGETVKFPYRMGRLELQKQKRGVRIVDGKLHITYPVNWNKTMKLWYEHPEEREKKTLIRSEIPYFFKVFYNKYDANFNNRKYYGFTLNRFIKRALRDNINNSKIDSLW